MSRPVDRKQHQTRGRRRRGGVIECELFATTYRRFGLPTVQFAAVDVEATVTPFDNGFGCTLDVHQVSKPRG